MKRFLAGAAALGLMVFPGSVEARVKVVVTYPYIESLVMEIAGSRADVTTLARANEDPHFVVPRPSFIGRLRQADLLIINGASLEIGFIPPLVRQANNRRVVPGAPGFVDLSRHVELIDKPERVSRAEGDVHPEGNPHFVLDWHNVPPIARAVADALAAADPGAAGAYRGNLEAFLAAWKARSDEWDAKAAALQGSRVIQYHRIFDYFVRRAGMTVAGELEPKPGIPPTSRHLEELMARTGPAGVSRIITDVYHEKKSPEGVARKLGVPWAVLPHDVGAVEHARDIAGLFDALLEGCLP